MTRGYGDKLTNRSAQRIRRDEDFKRSDKMIVWEDKPTPCSPQAGEPLEFPVEGRCAVVLDDKAGYCGAPNGENAFRFCVFHERLYVNKLVRTR